VRNITEQGETIDVRAWEHLAGMLFLFVHAKRLSAVFITFPKVRRLRPRFFLAGFLLRAGRARGFGLEMASAHVFLIRKLWRKPCHRIGAANARARPPAKASLGLERRPHWSASQIRRGIIPRAREFGKIFSGDVLKERQTGAGSQRCYREHLPPTLKSRSLPH